MSFKNKDVDKWTADEFMEFITSIGIKNAPFNAIKQAMDDNGLNGSDIRGSDVTIKDLFNINIILARKIKSNLDTIRIQQKPIVNDDDKNGFNVHVRATQGSLKTLTKKFTKESYISDVAQAYKDQEGIDAHQQVKDLILSSGSVTMEHGKKLKDYNIVDDNNRITIIFKTGGGMAALASSNNRVRTIKFTKYNLTKTSLPDELIGYNDSDGIPRALLDCGKHGLTGNTMYTYIITSLMSHSSQKHIYCPNLKCKKQLNWNKCTQIADMNFEEYSKWTEIVEQRSLGNVKKCPHCGIYCKRKDGVAIFRMSASHCNDSDWCWECGQTWKSSSLSMCNNQNCSIIKETNQRIANCDRVKVAYINVEMPEFRACPRCLTFIQYDSACKHMHCIGCDKEFCFVCLSLKDHVNDKWPCGDHYAVCKVADDQKFV